MLGWMRGDGGWPGEWGRDGQPGAEMRRGPVSAVWAPTWRHLCQGAKSRLQVERIFRCGLNCFRASGVTPYGPVSVSSSVKKG